MYLKVEPRRYGRSWLEEIWMKCGYSLSAKKILVVIFLSQSCIKLP